MGAAEPHGGARPAAGAASALARRARAALSVLRQAAANFAERRGIQAAAALSFFALFAFFPLVLLSAAAIGLALRDEGLRQDAVARVVAALPVEAPAVADALHALAGQGPAVGLLALAGMAAAASRLAAETRAALDAVFGASGRRGLLRGALADAAVLPALAALFLASLLLSAGWRIAQARAAGLGVFGGQALLREPGALAISGLISFAGFLILYRLLPHRAPPLRSLWPGALVAAAGFEAVKLGFAIYLANFDSYDVIYGSLGGALALLSWVFLSANVLLFGAEVAAAARGGAPVPRGAGRSRRAPSARRPLRARLREWLLGSGR